MLLSQRKENNKTCPLPYEIIANSIANKANFRLINPIDKTVVCVVCPAILRRDGELKKDCIKNLKGTYFEL